MNMPDKAAQNYSADFRRWGDVNIGTLKIDPTMADKSVDKILEDADLLFQPGKVDTFYRDPASGQELKSKASSIIRLDTGEELGHGMGGDYTPVGYLDSLQDIFGDIVELGGIPTRCVSFKRGAKAAIQFLADEIRLIGGRPHGTWFNVYGSMDGSTGVGFNLSDTCIVCGNTYVKSFVDSRLRQFARHTKNVSEHLELMGRAVLAVREQSQDYYTLLDKAISTPVARAIEQEFLNYILPDAPKTDKRDNSARSNQREVLANAIATTLAERNTNALTVYDVFQGALRYSNYKTGKRTETEQLEYVLDGPGAAFNDKAFSWLEKAIK